MTPGSLADDGWCVLPGAVDGRALEQLRHLAESLVMLANVSVRESSGAVYAARNVLSLVPEFQTAWKTPQLVRFIIASLGANAGLVRGLYFDKPPTQSWALPWHKDLLIAVEPFDSADGYSMPRPRAGVLHSEPPLSVLESMLTLRIHLDDVTPENGPLQVATGSHTSGKELGMEQSRVDTILARAGDVLAMTPLLAHCSGRSHDGCESHRRILHLEFSSLPALPGGIRWYTFLPVGPVPEDDS